MAQIIKRAIQNDAVDGSKLLLLNGQSLRARNAAGNADVSLFNLSNADEWEFQSLPKFGGSSLATEAHVSSSVGTEASARQAADGVLQDNIDAEVQAREAADSGLQGQIDTINNITIPNESAARQAGDAGLQSQIDTINNTTIPALTSRVETAEDDIDALEAADVTINGRIDGLEDDIYNEEQRALAAEAALQAAIDSAATSLKWRATLKLLSSDAELVSATGGTLLSDVLPLGDDDTPLMVVGDFAVGDLLMTKEATPKIFEVYDDAGDLKVQLAAQQPAINDTWVVKNDLPDAPGSQEGRAIYHYGDAGLVKLGDFDWSLASGIDLSPSFASSTGSVVPNDSVETAISKLVGNLAAEVSRAQAAESTLQDNIDTTQDEVDAVELALAQEVLDRQAADTAINNTISQVASDVAEEFEDLHGFNSVVTSGGTHVGVDNAHSYLFTGTMAHNLNLPDFNDLYVGEMFHIVNRSTGSITVRRHDLGNVSSSPVVATFTVGPGQAAIVTYIGSGSFVFRSTPIYTPTGLSAGNLKINSLANGTASTDAVNKSQLDAVQASVTALESAFENATTTDIAEGTNLYFTEARAKTAAVVDSMAGSQTDQAPSVSSVKAYVAANATRVELETFTLSSGDISNGYIDLAEEATIVFEVTPKGFPPQHPVDDYTLSVVSGKTRITFAGDMLSLEAGDKVKVAYSV